MFYSLSFFVKDVCSAAAYLRFWKLVCNCVISPLYSNVVASSISEGRQGAETSMSTAGSVNKIQRPVSRQKDVPLRSSAVRPSRDINNESTVLAGKLNQLFSFKALCYKSVSQMLVSASPAICIELN